MSAVFLTIIGLAAFEIISSIDNAIINAQVLGTIQSQRILRFFVTWGILIAVFAVRGILPLLIVYAANTDIGFIEAFGAMFSKNDVARQSIEASSPYLLLAGGTFLALLFVHWLFIEEKACGLPHESVLMQIGAVWFYAVASAMLCGLLYLVHSQAKAGASGLMLAASIGSVAFFITSGFKEHAEAAEMKMSTHGRPGERVMGDWAKVMFLEVIDLTFSIDGVVGAFAFTTVVPLILLGNGIGAIVVRQLTLGNIQRITRYAYLKNGAMYSIGVLAGVMIAEGFGIHVPSWVSPLATFLCIGAHFWLSVRRNRQEAMAWQATKERTVQDAVRTGRSLMSLFADSRQGDNATPSIKENVLR